MELSCSFPIFSPQPEETKETAMRLLILILLVILLIGALPTWPYSAGWGYYPSGGLGLLVVILVIVLLVG